MSLISILYLLNNKHFCQTKWSYKTLFTPISAIKKFTVSKDRKEWQKFSIVTGSLLFIIIGGRVLTVTIFSWEIVTLYGTLWLNQWKETNCVLCFNYFLQSLSSQKVSICVVCNFLSQSHPKTNKNSSVKNFTCVT